MRRIYDRARDCDSGGWLVPAPAYTQATGSLTGIVSDQSGAMMRGRSK